MAYDPLRYVPDKGYKAKIGQQVGQAVQTGILTAGQVAAAGVQQNRQYQKNLQLYDGVARWVADLDDTNKQAIDFDFDKVVKPKKNESHDEYKARLQQSLMGPMNKLAQQTGMKPEDFRAALGAGPVEGMDLQSIFDNQAKLYEKGALKQYRQLVKDAPVIDPATGKPVEGFTGVQASTAQRREMAEDLGIAEKPSVQADISRQLTREQFAAAGDDPTRRGMVRKGVMGTGEAMTKPFAQVAAVGEVPGEDVDLETKKQNLKLKQAQTRAAERNARAAGADKRQQQIENELSTIRTEYNTAVDNYKPYADKIAKLNGEIEGLKKMQAQLQKEQAKPVKEQNLSLIDDIQEQMKGKTIEGLKAELDMAKKQAKPIADQVTRLGKEVQETALKGRTERERTAAGVMKEEATEKERQVIEETGKQMAAFLRKPEAQQMFGQGFTDIMEAEEMVDNWKDIPKEVQTRLKKIITPGLFNLAGYDNTHPDKMKTYEGKLNLSNDKVQTSLAFGYTVEEILEAMRKKAGGGAKPAEESVTATVAGIGD